MRRARQLVGHRVCKHTEIATDFPQVRRKMLVLEKLEDRRCRRMVRVWLHSIFFLFEKGQRSAVHLSGWSAFERSIPHARTDCSLATPPTGFLSRNRSPTSDTCRPPRR